MIKALLIVFLSAILAAINVPASQFLLGKVPALLMGSLTFLGASLGTGTIFLIRVLRDRKNIKFLSGRDWLSVLCINVIDTGANIMLFYGIKLLSGETASLLQSFETVTTAIVAYLLFKEKPTWRLLLGIGVVFGASVLLSFDPARGYEFQPACLLIVGATICWGFDNNFMKNVASKDPFEFAFVKCFVPGIVILIIAAAFGQVETTWAFAGFSLLDGFVAYGLSVTLLVYGFRKLSASLGTAVYAMNPFIGAILSLIFFPKTPAWTFYVSIVLMLIGEGVVALDAHFSEKKKKAPNKTVGEDIIQP